MQHLGKLAEEKEEKEINDRKAMDQRGTTSRGTWNVEIVDSWATQFESAQCLGNCMTAIFPFQQFLFSKDRAERTIGKAEAEEDKQAEVGKEKEKGIGGVVSM